ncbi:MAG TPA: tetratricopeptide repeat protein, partial [Longimicrobiaceae bacterium]|nr:tetratricopeptide repeat protein [Longimicrobiaceae bacterium]
ALCRALEAEAAATCPRWVREPGPSGEESGPAAERLEALGRHFAEETVARDFLFDGADALLAAAGDAEGTYTPSEGRAFLRLLVALGGSGCRVVITSRRKHGGLWRAGVRPFRLSAVLAREHQRLLRAWAVSFGSWEQVEARLRTARGCREIEDLLRVLGGHPLAVRTAAYALRSLPVGAVAAALREGAALPSPPPGEAGHRSHELDVLVAEACRAPAVVPSAWGLLGLFRGCFGEGDLSALLARPELPPALRQAHPAADARRILVDGGSLGLAAPAAPPRGWEVIPSAAPRLEALWRRGLSDEEVRQVELAFVRTREEAARRHHRPDGDVSLAAVTFARRAERNLRRALDLAGAHGEWHAAYAVLAFLSTVWPTAGRRADADDLVAHWMKRAERELRAPRPDPPGLLDLWRLTAGQRARRLAAERRFRPALKLYRRIAKTLDGPGDEYAENLAVNTFLVGEVHQKRGALRAAAAAYRDALSRWEALGDWSGQSRACQALGSLEEERGRLDPARQWYARALDLDVALGDTRGAAGIHLSLGRLELRRDRLGTAEAWYRAGLELLAPFPPYGQTASFYSDLGLVAMEREQLDEAEASFRRALAIHESQRSRANVAAICHQLGLLEHRRGTASEWVEEERECFAAAERWYRRSARIERRRGDRPGAALSYHQLGVLEQDRGDLPAAERWYRKALACARGASDPEHPG